MTTTETTMAGTNAGLEIWDGDKVRCCSCKRWERQDKGGRIRHASYCETPDLQWTAPVAAPAAETALAEKVSRNRRAIREGAISAVLSDDEIVEAVKLGLVSNSDALNRDF